MKEPKFPDPLGLLAVALAATLWAIAATAARDLFDAGVDPLELAASRSVIAMAGLALLPAAWRRPQRPRIATTVILGLSIALVNGAYYLAIERLDVAVALVLQYTAPAMVVLWAAFVLRRRPTPDVLGALVATFLGVVLVSGLPSDVRPVDVAGVAFGIASAVLFATYTLVSERAGETYGVIGALFRGFVAATIFWIFFHAPRGFPGELIEPENLPTVLFVGIAGTLSPFLLFLWGVQRVRSERAAIAATLEPIIAAVTAWVWLGQSLGLAQLAGGAVIVAAVASLQVRRQRVPVLAPEP